MQMIQTAYVTMRAYLSLELIVWRGSGGFARVLKAELDGQPVAIKLLLPKWCDPENARCRAYQQHFIKEGRFLAKTSHRCAASAASAYLATIGSMRWPRFVLSLC